MNEQKMLKMFKKAAIANRDAITRSNYKVARKQFKIIAKINDQLRDSNKNLNKFYTILLLDKDLKVSSFAATICLVLGILTVRAKKKLKKISERQDIGVLSNEAETTLDEWEKNIKPKKVEQVLPPVINTGSSDIKVIIPCMLNGHCIYEYSMSDRDTEGMPFPKSKHDKRACPRYGHICPKFMEEFNLTPDDLNIRSTIHCGTLAKQMIEKGEWDLEKIDKNQADQIKALLKRLEEKLKKYPPEKYPKYYQF